MSNNTSRKNWITLNQSFNIMDTKRRKIFEETQHKNELQASDEGTRISQIKQRK